MEKKEFDFLIELILLIHKHTEVNAQMIMQLGDKQIQMTTELLELIKEIQGDIPDSDRREPYDHLHLLQGGKKNEKRPEKRK